MTPDWVVYLFVVLTALATGVLGCTTIMWIERRGKKAPISIFADQAAATDRKSVV